MDWQVDSWYPVSAVLHPLSRVAVLVVHIIRLVWADPRPRPAPDLATFAYAIFSSKNAGWLVVIVRSYFFYSESLLLAVAIILPGLCLTKYIRCLGDSMLSS